jgi:ABC-type multidrug transport system ATPase subunit
MKQKLALCCALVHRPDVLFLDEPTTGVDAVSRREFWELLARFKAGGLTILVSTPYMDEATRCDRVALMQRGQVLAIDTPAAITGGFDRPLFAVRAAQRYRALLALREYPEAHSVYPFGDVLHYTDRRTGLDAGAIREGVVGHLSGRGLTGVTAERIPATIEDSFMAHLGGATEPPPP